MNAIDLLKEDHRTVEAILEKIEATTPRAVKKRQELFMQLVEELKLHTHIEETLFYPPLKEHRETRSLIFSSYEEHEVVDAIIESLHGVDYTAEEWIAKIKVLRDNLQHHIKEEEKVLFPKAKKVMEKEELKEIGGKIIEMKGQEHQMAA